LSSYAVVRFNILVIASLSFCNCCLPAAGGTIPVMVMAFIGAIDTWWVSSLTYGIVGFLLFAFWLMKTLFEEVQLNRRSERVAGSYWRVFYRITLPIVKPGLANTGAFRVYLTHRTTFLLSCLPGEAVGDPTCFMSTLS